jgi:PEGA domain
VRIAPLSFLALVLATTGCASITASRADPYMIYSTPPGATVSVNGVPIGTTPVTVMVEKTKAVPAVSLSMPGYPAQSCFPRLSPGTGYIVADTLLCLFVPPLLGCIAFVDAAGAWNELEVNNCNVYFAPQGSPYDAAPPPPGYPPPPPAPGSDQPPPPPAPL